MLYHTAEMLVQGPDCTTKRSVDFQFRSTASTHYTSNNKLAVLKHCISRTSPRECLSIHIGQAGIQSGLSVWELLATEHMIRQDGHLATDNDIPMKEKEACCESLPVLFEESSGGRYSPRVVMVDFEPSVLDNIRCGFYNFFDLNWLISGKEDAVNFARGYYTVGQHFLEPTLEQVRQRANECDDLQGIFLFHSLGGGTGSGFGSLLMDALSDEFSKKSRFEYGIYPANRSSTFPSVLEPYNTVLASDKNLENFNCSILMDNQAICGICQKKLGIDQPTYQEMNRVLSEIVSCTTTPIRFHNTLNLNLTEFQVNLLPYPKAHFPVVGLAPILKPTKVFHEPLSVTSITYEAFEASNQLIGCDLAEGVFMACCLLYRGDLNPKDINATIDSLKNKKKCVNFLECCPTGFKVGLSSQPLILPKAWEMDSPFRSVCVLSNNTAVTAPWVKQNKKFDVMFSRKAFLHWYLSEGMEESQFTEARNNIETLLAEYEELQNYSHSENSSESGPNSENGISIKPKQLNNQIYAVHDKKKHARLNPSALIDMKVHHRNEPNLVSR